MPGPGIHVDELKAAVTGYARAYMFNIVFTSVPPAQELKYDKIAYLVKSGTLPGSSIEPLEVAWQGQVQKIGGTHTFDTWEVTFNVDYNATIKKSMDKWSKAVHDPTSNIHGKPKDYYGSANVELLDTKGEPLVTYKIVDMWPSEVAAIELGQETKEIATFAVTFTYNYHEIV